MRLNGTSPTSGNFTSRFFPEPKVIVETKDGRKIETTRRELRKQGMDPNNGDDWWEKLKDLFYDFQDWLGNNRSLFG